MLAASVATVSSLIGTILSFHLDASTGPCIVVVQALFFMAALTVNQVRSARRASAPA